jgi:methyl halide transferase
MQHLLAPFGILVCLEFPLYKALEAEGQPGGLKGAYWNLLAEGGDGCVKDVNEGNTIGKGYFTRVLYYIPERPYSIRKGTDKLSVWAVKNS